MDTVKGKILHKKVPHKKTTAEKPDCDNILWKYIKLFMFSHSRDRTFSYSTFAISNAFFPQCYFVVCLLKGQRRRMQPEHTEPLFILAAAGLLQGHDPEGMKKRASIQLTSVTLPGVKTKHLCIFTVLVMVAVNYRG